jgi:hypothetical protein
MTITDEGRSTDYAVPGPLTGLAGVPVQALQMATDDPVEICWPVAHLFLQPDAADARGLPAERLDEKNIRPAQELVARLLALDARPLVAPRDPMDRVVGTCRHFAVLSCALLRHRGIAARVRCGFATYFRPGQSLDHWTTEYRDPGTGRWVRFDPEILGQAVLSRPDDLEPGQFLSGAEAWVAYRRGDVDPATFGVHGTENWGAPEIRGNAVKDFAALNKVEMLPWDEWGRMTEAYEGRTGPDYDDLLDTVAAVSIADDAAEVAGLYAHGDLVVPPALIC